jgi:hypothetical protein
MRWGSNLILHIYMYHKNVKMSPFSAQFSRFSRFSRFSLFSHAGSSLQQLSIHIPKLLHYASGLVFDNVTPPLAPPPPHSGTLPTSTSYSSEHVTPHATPTVRGGATGTGSQVTAVVSTHGEKLNLNQVHTCT